jgi:hypothetical protein
VELALERWRDLLTRVRSGTRRRWLLEGTRVHRLGIHREPSAGSARALFITHDHRISQSQIHPFFYYRQEILSEFGWEFRQRNVGRFMQAPSASDAADIVFVQPWFSIGADGVSRLLDAVDERCRPKKVVFLDSYAPTDLRFASTVVDRVDVYVKKHVLRDRSRYHQPVLGDTLLTDYYARRYDLTLPLFKCEVPDAFFSKLLVGPSFATYDWMMEILLSGQSSSSAKEFDVHARLGSGGAPWYNSMRLEAEQRIRGISGLNAVVGVGASKSQYISELQRSRICFSPFGYGEVAWRDYEAVVCGAALLKPDMSHCETNPNIFVPNETYVPVRWDFSDLEEKVRWLLSEPKECERISRNAFAVLHGYLASGSFLEHLAPALRLPA